MDIDLTVHSAGHFLTDAVCAAMLFGGAAAAGNLTVAVPLYNTLAFSTQCLVGLVTDGRRGHRRMAAAGLAAAALALLLPLPWVLRVIAAGLGNSLFHVAAGTVTLENAGGRAGPLGIFVAPGALGLALGTLYPGWGLWFALAALLLCVPMALAPEKEGWNRSAAAPAPRPAPRFAAAALLTAVAVRAVGGTAVSFPWKTTGDLALLTVGFVFAGKLAGGFLCDRLGPKRTALLSLPAAAVLIAFGASWMLPSLLGQLLLNLTMPVTLWLLYRTMPDAPGLAFGLAASALWPGTLAGGFLKLTGPALWLCILVSFLFGLGAVLYSEKTIRE